MDVDENKQLRRRRVVNVGLLLETGGQNIAVGSNQKPVDRLTHVIAPCSSHGECNAIGCFHGRFVGRTMIDGHRTVVGEEQTPFDVRSGRVVTGQSRTPRDGGTESHGRPSGIDVVNVVVGGEHVVVNARVQMPLALEQFNVVESGDVYS